MMWSPRLFFLLFFSSLLNFSQVGGQMRVCGRWRSGRGGRRSGERCSSRRGGERPERRRRRAKSVEGECGCEAGRTGGCLPVIGAAQEVQRHPLQRAVRRRRARRPRRQAVVDQDAHRAQCVLHHRPVDGADGVVGRAPGAVLWKGSGMRLALQLSIRRHTSWCMLLYSDTTTYGLTVTAPSGACCSKQRNAFTMWSDGVGLPLQAQLSVAPPACSPTVAAGSRAPQSPPAACSALHRSACLHVHRRH